MGKRGCFFSLALLCLFFLGYGSAFAADGNQGKSAQKTVNVAAAIRSLEKCTLLLASSDWSAAEFEARLGFSYDATLADFSYIEALSLAARGFPRADTIERLEYSLAPGLFWRTYSRNDALLLCARLYSETNRYAEALSRISTITDIALPDVDYVRILSSYGLGKIDEARSLVLAALDKWPFDPRFPRVFLINERARTPTANSKKLASTILSRLYLWENEDRELLLLAVPFESDPAVRQRNIRIYRNMRKDDGLISSRAVQNPLATVYALEYGIIGEDSAFDEIFSAENTGISLSSLSSLCSLIGTATSRTKISSRLVSYSGIITDDANGDGYLDSKVLYRLGRPVEGIFDPDQDGYPDFTVNCDLGLPTSITLRKGRPLVNYDTYPFVRSVTDGDREYTIKPLGFAWAPLDWILQDFRLDGVKFYTIALTGKENTLTERLLVQSSAFFSEPAADRKGAITRVVLDSGIPVSSESRDRGQVYSWTSWTRGYPSLTKADRDGDAYFETTMTYTNLGILQTVVIDRNGNRKNEYREEYFSDGSSKMQWDSDENGLFEITWTVTPEKLETTTWLHPDTGRPVIITVEEGMPRSVIYGEIRATVIKDPVENLWWINRIPSKSREIVMKINNILNREDPSVVSCSITVDGKRIHAVRTGGLVFAESMDE